MIPLARCSGCRDDFYNRKNPLGVSRCWFAKTGRMVKRYATGTWTMPASKGAFTEVRVPSCYNRTGTHYTDRLPHFVKAEDVIRSKRAP